MKLHCFGPVGGAGVIIRGVRNRSDLRCEYQLAAITIMEGMAMMAHSGRCGLHSLANK